MESEKIKLDNVFTTQTIKNCRYNYYPNNCVLRNKSQRIAFRTNINNKYHYRYYVNMHVV
jgi:hypothetical protein